MGGGRGGGGGGGVSRTEERPYIVETPSVRYPSVSLYILTPWNKFEHTEYAYILGPMWYIVIRHLPLGNVTFCVLFSIIFFYLYIYFQLLYCTKICGHRCRPFSPLPCTHLPCSLYCAFPPLVDFHPLFCQLTLWRLPLAVLLIVFVCNMRTASQEVHCFCREVRVIELLQRRGNITNRQQFPPRVLPSQEPWGILVKIQRRET